MLFFIVFHNTFNSHGKIIVLPSIIISPLIPSGGATSVFIFLIFELYLTKEFTVFAISRLSVSQYFSFTIFHNVSLFFTT